MGLISFGVKSIKSGRNVAKFLLNRARGVEYGCVRVGKGPIKLVESSKLYKMNCRLIDKIGDYSSHLPAEKLKTIEKQLKPFNVKVNAANPLCYGNVHGSMQVYDDTNKKAVVDVVDRLKNPIKDYLRALFGLV